MLKKRNRLLAFLFFLFVSSPLFVFEGNVWAQAIDVEGQVRDANTNESLVGVNIVIQGTTRGTTTDMDGRFRISADSDEVLVFRYIGYRSLEIPVDGQTSLDVRMRAESIYGDEIVFIGYGVRRVEDNTGSINTVTANNFNQGGVTSAGELFQGRIPGVEVTTSDGAPGAGTTIRVRGGSSLSASNDPLFVVDGVILEGGDISGMRNPLNTINPNDIESITVLKDASATAIYGSRASNGVIVITTKRGRVGEPLSVNYNGKLTVHTRRSTVDLLSTEEFRGVVSDLFGDRGTQYFGTADTDWQDEIYRNSISQDHNISVSGAYGNLPFHASFGFTDNNGILKTSHSERMTGAISISPSFLDDHLRVDLNLRGSREDNRFGNREAIGAAVAFDPTQPVRVDDDRFGGYFAWLDQSGNPIPIATSNPVALLNQTRDEATVYRSVGNLKLDYTLPFFTDLTATLNVGYDYSDVGTGRNYVRDDAAFAFEDSRLLSGSRTDYEQRRENQLLDFYVNYGKELPSIQSNLDVTGGYSWSHHYESGSNYSTNYNRAHTLVVFQDTEYKTEYYLVSFFGRANYTLKDRYLLTATIRADGSSRFAEDNRWGYFPSLALAWNLHRESFMQDIPNLSQLKLRLGYGVTGQQDILQGNYPYLARYTFSEPTADYQFGDEFVQTLRPEGYNTTLKWEETTTYNIGVDYGLYNNRLRGSVDVYHKKTEDLLNIIPVPAGTNFTNEIISNIGTLEVQGIEFNVTGALIAREDAYWQVSFNATHNVNEITSLTAVDDPSYIGVVTGGIAGGVGNNIQIHSVGHPRSAFYVYEQVYDQDGNPLEGVYVDRNGDGVVNESDMYRLGSPDPDWSFGFSSNVRYQNWDASFSARAQIGNYVYNNVASEYGFYNDMLYGQYLRNSPLSVKETNFLNERFHSDHYVEDASFLRMDNISVGYTIDNPFNYNTTLRVSGTVNNVFVITNYSGLDPEVFGGIDNEIYPRPRTFVLGLNLTF